MFGGFGVMDEMNKSFQRNRQLLHNAKESFKRRKGIKLSESQNKAPEFPVASPDELARIRKFLEAKAQKQKRKTSFVFVGLGLACVVTLMVMWSLGHLSTEGGPRFQRIEKAEQLLVQRSVNSLERSMNENNHSTFRNMWHKKPTRNQSTLQSSINLSIVKNGGSAVLKNLEFFEWHAIATIVVFEPNRVSKIAYELKIFNGKPVLTDMWAL